MKRIRERIALANGCSCSHLTVHPRNWKTTRASIRETWYIGYRFFDPIMGTKQRFLRGMNEYKTLEARQEITRALLENEMYLLRNRCYNPHTNQVSDPDHAEYEIHPTTPFIHALNAAMSKVTAARSTMADLKSVIKGTELAAEQLRYQFMEIREVRRKHILAILDRCSKTIPRWSAHRHNQYRTYLRILFKKLVQYEAIEFNPVSDIDKAKTVKRIRQTLTMEERKRVDRELRAGHYTFWRYMHIFFHSGARGTELLAMRREDVDLSGGRYKSIIKKGKQYVERWRPIKVIAAPLWEEVVQEAKAGEFLFSRGLTPGAAQIRPDQIGKRWKRLVKEKMGISADLYSLKHSNATEMVELMGERAAMEQTGHTSPGMLRAVYDIRYRDREDEKVRMMGNKFA